MGSRAGHSYLAFCLRASAMATRRSTGTWARRSWSTSRRRSFEEDRSIRDAKCAEAWRVSHSFRKRYVSRRPAKYSGRMLYFSVEIGAEGESRFLPYSLDGALMVCFSLSSVNFCVWMITSQLPYLSPSELWSAVSAMEAAGLVASVGKALRIIRNSSS